MSRRALAITILILLCSSACSTIPNRSSMSEEKAVATVDSAMARVKSALGDDLNWVEERRGTIDGCEGLSGPTEWFMLRRRYQIEGLEQERGAKAVTDFDSLWPPELKRFRGGYSVVVRGGKFDYRLAYYPETKKLILSGTTPCIRDPS